MEQKIRVMVVDDEPLARERLRALLELQPDLEVIGECGDGGEALETLRQDRPDLVFLDIQMPELDGFEVLERLGTDRPPAVIFVTAYDQFAIRAFEVHALDYLLKPYDDERFGAALDRARTWLKTKGTAGELDARMTAFLADMRTAAKPADRLAVKSGGRVILIKTEDIDWVESADNYVNLHVGAEAYLLRETMNALEQRLPANRFLRISRSTLVNLDRIKELQPMFHGEYTVILRSGTRLTLSRGYREKLDVLMGRPGA
jgi:two-component system, LytTR family, response regulator